MPDCITPRMDCGDVRDEILAIPDEVDTIPNWQRVLVDDRGRELMLVGLISPEIETLLRQINLSAGEMRNAIVGNDPRNEVDMCVAQRYRIERSKIDPQLAHVLQQVLRRRTVVSVAEHDIPLYLQIFLEGRLPVDRLKCGTNSLDEFNSNLAALRQASVLRQILPPNG